MCCVAADCSTDTSPSRRIAQRTLLRRGGSLSVRRGRKFVNFLYGDFACAVAVWAWGCVLVVCCDAYDFNLVVGVNEFAEFFFRFFRCRFVQL